MIGTRYKWSLKMEIVRAVIVYIKECHKLIDLFGVRKEDTYDEDRVQVLTTKGTCYQTGRQV